MPALTAADTIRILVATDNHVGYNERDPVRGDDSWKTFHEIMCLAKDRDVDMVLLAGDLFHENKPSRKSMYNVMRSLRMNCYGEKPCELEMLSDASETLGGDFDHVNYEDLDINVAIPVFSIHGNHDDPSGEGHYAALDLLQCSGLLNYYGRTPESDNIQVKPVLLQKGRTKVALYGLSNVRDERLYRTFRDGKVKFFQPATQKEDWFNIMSVHQNHHAYTETSHLPENFLPNFLDLVIWGHEHECDIQPHINPEMNFKVMQPGSSVATSLVAGEAVPKQVAILSITGREFKSVPIRLKTVRPFVYKDLVLSEHQEAMQMARRDNHRTELTRFLVRLVDELIEQAIAEWQEAQEEDRTENYDEEPPAVPLPLIRLRVETSIPNSTASFDVENPQRFSNRFVGKVANTNDVVQFHRKKKTALSSIQKAAGDVEEQEIMAHLQGLDTVRVEKLVREFLAAQSLTILPQNYFGDAVNQFVDKDDKHAMESFVNESLTSQIKHLLNMDPANGDEDEDEENSLAAQIDQYRSQLEEMFSKGVLKKRKGNKNRFKPKPSNWDSDLDGDWEDQPGALLRPEEDNGSVMDDEGEEQDETPKPRGARGRGRGSGARGARGARGAASGVNRKVGVAAKKPAAASSRSRKKVVEEEKDEDEDVVMLDDDEDEDDSQAMFFKDKASGTSTRGKKPASTATRTRKAASPIKKPPPRSAAVKGRQATLNFTASQASVLGLGRRRSRSQSLSDNIEDDDDDDDAFEPISSARIKSRR
jgi:double-strand break repair protein MRE11